MNSQLLYQEDVTELEFEANIVELLTLPGGRTGVVLDRTYFYPTGGGQEHDNGTIGITQVIDVYKDDERLRLVHVVEGEVSLGPVHATIDAERRLRHMQHHTAQHLLTQCILRQAGLETVSANINGFTPSTLDLAASQISKADLDQAEVMANRMIYEDRQVKSYIVTPEELNSIPLRRPPKVKENIRIVEIDSFDYSPCGGTHVLRTGSIGLVKVVRVEKQSDKQRVHFIAGLQAMAVFHEMYDSVSGIANQLSMAWQELPGLISRQADQLASLQKELQPLRLLAIKNEAHTLVENATLEAGTRSVRSSFENRPVTELRLLAEEMRKVPDLVACLASFDGQKVSMVVICGEASGKDARQLLNDLLASIHGRGGGDAHLAQGGGAASPEQFQAIFQSAES